MDRDRAEQLYREARSCLESTALPRNSENSEISVDSPQTRRSTPEVQIQEVKDEEMRDKKPF